MKIARVLPIYILALCAMECSVSAFRLEEKDFPGEIQNDGSFSDAHDEPEEDPGILENIEKALDPCGKVWTKFGEYCYHVSGEMMTENEAQQYCDEEMDANLAKINSQQENNFVLDLVHRHAPLATRVWIGLKWENSPKDFYWYDHSFPTFKSWAPGQPSGKASEPCVEMFVGQKAQLPQGASGYWNDVRCNVKLATVCKKLY